MKSVLIVFFIVLFLVLLVAFPFKIRMAGHINLFEMKAYYCFKVWRFKFLCGKTEVDGVGKIKVENSNNMFSKDIDKDFAKVFAKQMAAEVDVKKIELFFTGGLEEDSYASALMCGGVASVVYSLYGYLSQQYENVKLYEDITPTFSENNLELTFDGVVAVSLFGIMKTLIKSKFEMIRLEESKNER